MIDSTKKQFGNYQLTHVLGEGAFARVYLGEHIYLGTQAAIKVLKTQAENNPMDWFVAEARHIAHLVHPNIVRVLEFGVEGNTPFLVLDYAPNGTLRQRHPQGLRLPLVIVVKYIRQIAEALQYAHDEKLIHRDVKPENILIGRRNEVLLSDFGIALMTQNLQSQRVDVAGTLPYIAPEQLQGHPVMASDQFSLGVIVYEWLTGQRPFNGSLTEIATQHLALTPLTLRGKMSMVAPAVEQVVLTALAKEPQQRFGSVLEFAVALEQVSRTEVLAQDQLEKPVLASNVAVVAPTVALTSGSRIGSWRLPRRTGPIKQAVPGTVVYDYRGHTNPVHSLSWSATGNRIASASNDRTVHVWDVMMDSRHQIYQDVSEAVQAVSWSVDGSHLATVGSDARIRIWDFASDRLLTTYEGHAASAIMTIAWSPLPNILASAAADGAIHVWDAMTGQTLTVYRGHIGSVNALAWAPDSSSEHGYRIVSGGEDTSMQLWEAPTGRNISVYRGQPARILSVGWSPDVYPLSSKSDPTSHLYNSSRVGCGRVDGMVQMWDTTTEREVMSYRYGAAVTSVGWSPDGSRFAYASDNRTIEVWDTTTNLRLFTFTHSAPIHVMAWSPDGKYIASGGGDTTIQIWVAPESRPV